MVVIIIYCCSYHLSVSGDEAGSHILNIHLHPS